MLNAVDLLVEPGAVNKVLATVQSVEKPNREFHHDKPGSPAKLVRIVLINIINFEIVEYLLTISISTY